MLGAPPGYWLPFYFYRYDQEYLRLGVEMNIGASGLILGYLTGSIRDLEHWGDETAIGRNMLKDVIPTSCPIGLNRVLEKP